MRVRSLCLGLAALAIGCGGSDGGSTVISSQPLSGKIGGQAWTFMTGETDAYLSNASKYWVAGYSETFTACTGFPPSGTNQLLMNLPTAIGNYPVNVSRIQTFHVAATNDNLGATSGEIDITDISATTITGAAKFAFNADNSVDGQFQVTICP